MLPVEEGSCVCVYLIKNNSISSIMLPVFERSTNNAKGVIFVRVDYMAAK